jgi:hypothetical protein
MDASRELSQSAGGVREPADIEALRRADQEITAALKGPMSNIERALLVADRRDIRAAISQATGDGQ